MLARHVDYIALHPNRHIVALTVYLYFFSKANIPQLLKNIIQFYL